MFLRGTLALSPSIPMKGRPSASRGKWYRTDARRTSASRHPRVTSAGASSATGADAPLPAGCNGIEPVVGADLSEVRVRTGTAAERAAAAIGARAFTHDGEIWLGAGQRADNVALMAHEAAHVVQQRNGRHGVIHRLVDFDITDTTITTEALTDITDEELNGNPTAGGSPRTLLQDTPSTDATENMTVLEKEVKRRADAARMPPVIFGMDTDTRAIYASVPVPRNAVTEISTSRARLGRQGRRDSIDQRRRGEVPPGRNLRLPPGALAEGASTEVNQALETGSILVPKASRKTMPVTAKPHLSLAAGGRRYEVTEGQLRGMLQGLGVWITARPTTCTVSPRTDTRCTTTTCEDQQRGSRHQRLDGRSGRAVADGVGQRSLRVAGRARRAQGSGLQRGRRGGRARGGAGPGTESRQRRRGADEAQAQWTRHRRHHRRRRGDRPPTGDGTQCLVRRRRGAGWCDRGASGLRNGGRRCSAAGSRWARAQLLAPAPAPHSSSPARSAARRWGRRSRRANRIRLGLRRRTDVGREPSPAPFRAASALPVRSWHPVWGT